MNYYSVPDPWKVPKWIAAILGCAFLVIAVGTAVTIVQLTRPAAAAVLQSGTPPPPPPPLPEVAATETPADVATPPGPITRKHAEKAHVAHHKKKKAAHLAKAKRGAKRVLVARRATGSGSGKLAPGPDALDKLLGLK